MYYEGFDQQENESSDVTIADVADLVAEPVAAEPTEPVLTGPTISIEVLEHSNAVTNSQIKCRISSGTGQMLSICKGPLPLTWWTGWKEAY